MKKLDAVSELLQIKDEELSQLDMDQLRNVLGSLRFVIRGIEREVMKREWEQGAYQEKKSKKTVVHA